MPNKRRSTRSASDDQVHTKKTRINGLSKSYKFFSWVETSLQKSPPELDYFSFAEQINDTVEVTNTSYKDLLLILQQKQSNKLINIAHRAEITFTKRYNKNSDFAKQYMRYWEDRKDHALSEDINDESRATISSIQQLVNNTIREKANNVFVSSSQNTSGATRFDSTSSDLSPSNMPSDENITKTLAQTANLASDHVGQLNIVDLSSESVRDTLKSNTTKEEYDHIMSSVNIEEVEMTDNANKLIDGIRCIENLSSRKMRNALYQYGYNQDHDFVAESDTGVIENLTRHFLDLIESPSNPLNKRILERTAAVYTSVVIINQLFLAVNDIVELEWLEREFHGTNKTKWDGILFKTGHHNISPGFVEFSGGANGASPPEKERRDIRKLYNKMVDVLNGYPSHIKKEIFCMRYYDNTIFFEKLVLHEDMMFRIQHVKLTVPTTTRLLSKFVLQIPKLLSWRNAILKHVEQF